MPIPAAGRTEEVILNAVMAELAQAIAAYTQTHTRVGDSFWKTEMDGLLLLRSDHEKSPSHHLSRPALCVVAQGAKWTSFGNERHSYRAGEALVVTIEMPSVGRVFEASADMPFLGAVVEFSPAVLREVLEQLPLPPARRGEIGPGGAAVVRMDRALADCVVRMVRVLDTPEAMPILAPMLMREFSYWLLAGPLGGRIVEMTLGHDRWEPVLRAIGLLREHFAKPLRIADLAAEAGLSQSVFHRQFKTVTSLTPIQYQKQLRLLEARRMLLTERTKVESAAYAMGYESPSQFSREYTRMFGCSPKQDARSGMAFEQ